MEILQECISPRDEMRSGFISCAIRTPYCEERLKSMTVADLQQNSGKPKLFFMPHADTD